MRKRPRLRVLFVEDDPEMLSAYRRFFGEARAREFHALLASDAESAAAILRAGPVDVVVLDWRLPGISGAALAKALRADARSRGIGVLMVTARAETADAVEALDSGADDYLAKPFDWSVLLARLRSVARRANITLERRRARAFPGLELDLDADRLRVDGREVPLPPKEMTLLRIFLTRPELLHEHAYLWEAAWGRESENWEHTLTATISSLRRKLGPVWGPRLQSHKGRGFIFSAEAPRIP